MTDQHEQAGLVPIDHSFVERLSSRGFRPGVFNQLYSRALLRRLQMLNNPLPLFDNLRQLSGLVARDSERLPLVYAQIQESTSLPATVPVPSSAPPPVVQACAAPPASPQAAPASPTTARPIVGALDRAAAPAPMASATPAATNAPSLAERIPELPHSRRRLAPPPLAGRTSADGSAIPATDLTNGGNGEVQVAVSSVGSLDEAGGPAQVLPARAAATRSPASLAPVAPSLRAAMPPPMLTMQRRVAPDLPLARPLSPSSPSGALGAGGSPRAVPLPVVSARHADASQQPLRGSALVRPVVIATEIAQAPVVFSGPGLPQSVAPGHMPAIERTTGARPERFRSPSTHSVAALAASTAQLAGMIASDIPVQLASTGLPATSAPEQRANAAPAVAEAYGAQAATGPALDIDDLVERTLQRFTRRLAVERERRGG